MVLPGAGPQRFIPSPTAFPCNPPSDSRQKKTKIPTETHPPKHFPLKKFPLKLFPLKYLPPTIFLAEKGSPKKFPRKIVCPTAV